MALTELFVAVLIAGVSAINASVPLVVWSRARDGRFLLLAAGNGVLVVLGAVWAWGQLPGSPPGYAVVQLPILLLAFLATLLLLGTTVWPRRA